MATRLDNAALTVHGFSPNYVLHHEKLPFKGLIDYFVHEYKVTNHCSRLLCLLFFFIFYVVISLELQVVCFSVDLTTYDDPNQRYVFLLKAKLFFCTMHRE
jgi:hypothetical protein